MKTDNLSVQLIVVVPDAGSSIDLVRKEVVNLSILHECDIEYTFNSITFLCRYCNVLSCIEQTS